MGRNDIFLSEMRAKVCVLLGSFRAVPKTDDNYWSLQLSFISYICLKKNSAYNKYNF